MSVKRWSCKIYWTLFSFPEQISKSSCWLIGPSLDFVKKKRTYLLNNLPTFTKESSDRRDIRYSSESSDSSYSSDNRDSSASNDNIDSIDSTDSCVVVTKTLFLLIKKLFFFSFQKNILPKTILPIIFFLIFFYLYTEIFVLQKFLSHIKFECVQKLRKRKIKPIVTKLKTSNCDKNSNCD